MRVQRDVLVFDNPDCETSLVIRHLLRLIVQERPSYDTDDDLATPHDLWAQSLQFSQRYSCTILIQLLRAELLERLLLRNIPNLRAFVRAAALGDMRLACSALDDPNLHTTWRTDAAYGRNVLDITVLPAAWKEALPDAYYRALHVAWHDANAVGGTWTNLMSKFLETYNFFSKAYAQPNDTSGFSHVEQIAANHQVPPGDGNGQAPAQAVLNPHNGHVLDQASQSLPRGFFNNSSALPQHSQAQPLLPFAVPLAHPFLGAQQSVVTQHQIGVPQPPNQAPAIPLPQQVAPAQHVGQLQSPAMIQYQPQPGWPLIPGPFVPQGFSNPHWDFYEQPHGNGFIVPQLLHPPFQPTQHQWHTPSPTAVPNSSAFMGTSGLNVHNSAPSAQQPERSRNRGGPRFSRQGR